MLDLAEKDSRILLTRDLDLHRRAIKNNIKSVLVEETEDMARQLLEISKSIDGDLEISLRNSRCPVCNGKLKPEDKSRISGEVPEAVIEKNEKFWRCGVCNKIYWPGSHWKKITETVERYEDLRG